jgi:hypothetical protein
MTKVKEQLISTRPPVFRDQLVTIGDLQQFQSEILVAVRRMLTELAPAPPSRWLKTNQARKLLNCSSGTLLTLRSNGTLPFTRVGGTIFYNSNDIEQLLCNHRQHLVAGKNSIGLSQSHKR